MNPLRWLWPPLDPHEELPKAEGMQPGTTIVFDYARGQVARQNATYDSIDGKAATIIGAVLVVLGLVLPNVRAVYLAHWLALGALLALVLYALSASFAAYSVTALKVGVLPATLTRAMTKDEETVRAAMAIHLLGDYVQNKPIIRRKGLLVRRGLLALALSVVPLIVLSLTGAIS